MQLREVAAQVDTGAQDKQLQLGLLGSSDAVYQQHNRELAVSEGELGRLERELQQAKFELLQFDSAVAQAAHGSLGLRGGPEDEHPPARRARARAAPGRRAAQAARQGAAAEAAAQRRRKPSPKRPQSEASAVGGPAGRRRPDPRISRGPAQAPGDRPPARAAPGAPPAPAAASGALGGIWRGGEGGAPGTALGRPRRLQGDAGLPGDRGQARVRARRRGAPRVGRRGDPGERPGDRTAHLRAA